MYGTSVARAREDGPMKMVTVCGLAAIFAFAGVVGFEYAQSNAYATAAVRPAVQAGVFSRAQGPSAGLPLRVSTVAVAPAEIPVALPSAGVLSQVNGATGAMALGFTALVASIALLLKKPAQPASVPVAMFAASGAKRPVWLPGATPPAYLTGEFPGDRGFDPLGFSKQPATFERMRAAEIFHGRLAMLGVVGAIVPELQGTGAWYALGDKQFGPGPNGEVIGFTELAAIGLLFSYPLEYWRGNGGFGWGEQTGDRIYPGFDPLQLTSDHTKTAEVKNGRLAMTALLGFAVQHAATGASPLENWAAATGGSVAMFATSGERPTWFPGAKAPPHLTGEFPGDRGFDPVDFGANPATFERMRASEVFHGRLAMLGVAGCLLPEILGNGAWFEAGESVDVGSFSLYFLALAAPLEYWRGNGGFGWEQKEKSTGNRIYPGFDPMKMASADMKTKEIKNGRLAMIAFLGLVSQANTTGASPLENLASALGGGSVAMF